WLACNATGVGTHEVILEIEISRLLFTILSIELSQAALNYEPNILRCLSFSCAILILLEVPLDEVRREQFPIFIVELYESFKLVPELLLWRHNQSGKRVLSMLGITLNAFL